MNICSLRFVYFNYGYNDILITFENFTLITLRHFANQILKIF